MSTKDPTTTNPCKCCTPLGASMAFKGVSKSITLLHGSQGCATYIRRYCISHFREPIDIASSSFSEESAVFGGRDKLKNAIDNILNAYHPEIIGIASTCLSETIGDDISLFIKEYISEKNGTPLPHLINVSTPSYRGTHIKGFHQTTKAIVSQITQGEKLSNEREGVNLFPSFISPEDLRYLKEVCQDFRLPYQLLPDYSETLDGGRWTEYEKLPKGGTTIDSIKNTIHSKASIELGQFIAEEDSASAYLKEIFNVPFYKIPLPIGVKNTDRFFSILEKLSDLKIPDRHFKERDRLLDALADGHKYLFGKKVVLIGDENQIHGLMDYTLEMGLEPIICATGSINQNFLDSIEKLNSKGGRSIKAYHDLNFSELDNILEKEETVDLIIGNSKAFKTAKKFNTPLIRVGFPIHDRFGANRVNLIGYRGAQRLLDEIVNTFIAQKQENSTVGYTYI